MAKRKVDTIEDILKREYNEKMSLLQFIPEPTYFFEIGEEVAIGNLADVHILESCENGKFYLIEYSIKRKETSYASGKFEEKITLESGHKKYFAWTELRPINKTEESLIQNDNLRLSFTQQTISSLLHKVYHFGTDMDPDYQREYCWELEDKVALIDSIFRNIDIGKFVFVHNDYSDEYLYEILDGKQRLRAILDFYENRFAYKGKYFNDLSKIDQHWFTDYCVSVAEVLRSDKKEILNYFVMLNTTGKPIDTKHIDKVKNMIKSCE
jgi:hypothetical protein